ncbi:hypothetical protein LQ567_04990 [Niabella pedocola]|uniref:Uncharacterized protein n=1 Tax=Niabella pedocola TaxID=1752077 RepID=A0ABS8PLX6_9BACT|nr:hypothetical protein [Niabella pedocola]MCD2422107.1 hypothetical protein [Niabella pedocola]
MSKDQFNTVSKLNIRGGGKEIVSTNVCFTGNAIALLNAYAATGTAIHLDDWDGYNELRGGSLYYIVTDIKKAVLSV